MEKCDSNQLSLTTASILGQPPRYGNGLQGRVMARRVSLRTHMPSRVKIENEQDDILRTVTATDFSRSLFADSGVAETVA